MRAAAYLRVSSIGQAGEEKYGYDRQIKEIRAYAHRNGLTITAEYRDAITGKTATRIELQRLFQDVDQYDAVIVSAVDRLARSFVKGAQIAEELHEAGFTVISADVGPVFDSDSRTLQFHVSGAFAEFEAKKIAQRTISAKIAMAEEGKLPLGISAYGYESDGEGGARIVPHEANIIRRIFQQRAKGISYRSIAKALNNEGVPTARPQAATTHKNVGGIWHGARITKIVRSPTYRGQYKWSHKGATWELSIPPIVSKALWRKAQLPKGRRKSPTGWPLVGYLRCGVCGRTMNARHVKKSNRRRDYEYYRCASHASMTGSCAQAHIPRASLEQLVEKAIRSKLTNPDFLRELAGRAETPREPPAHLLVLKRERSRLLAAYRKGALDLDEFVTAREEVDQQIRELMLPPVVNLPVDAIASAARTLPIREFLVESGVVIIVRDANMVEFEFSLS